MQQHTPGPWVIGQEATDLMACPEGGRFHAIDAPDGNHYALAVVVTQLSDPTEKSTEQLQANARLIAAAPELLAALQRAIDEAVADDLDDWFANARAVIAKATGVAL